MYPALLVIDQQCGIRADRLGLRNHPDAERHLLALLTAWRERKAPCVHVRHLSLDPQSVFWPGQPGAEFQSEFLPLTDETILDKHTPDAFANTGLERWLHQRGITDLVIGGVASENSVEATARSAGNLGFRTWVAQDACYTFAKADYHGRARSADEVHAMAMANLHGEYATVAQTAWLIEHLRTIRAAC